LTNCIGPIGASPSNHHSRRRKKDDNDDRT
jgi:hypothetical protein